MSAVVTEHGTPPAQVRAASIGWVLPVTVGAAWVTAIAAEVTGRSRLLHHDTLIEGHLPLIVALAVFVLAWQLMIAAMMLPSTLPMIGLFRGWAASDQRPTSALAAFLGGYVAIWTAFGALAFLFDAAIHRTVDANPWLADRPWLVAGTLLVAAGAAQVLPLTQACLHSCRHPFVFLLHRYRRGVRGAFAVGRSHGIYCLGCCWALMLVMFAAGVANVAWMAALAAVMVYEKVGRRGERLSLAVGVVLVAWGAFVLVHPPWLPHELAGVD